MFYSNQQAFLLENVPCNNVSCKSVRRMFRVFWELSDLNQIKDAVVATFFDIYEDVSAAPYPANRLWVWLCPSLGPAQTLPGQPWIVLLSCAWPSPAQLDLHCINNV